MSQKQKESNQRAEKNSELATEKETGAGN